MMPLNSFNPLATAIPRHKGMATKKTTMDEGISEPIEEKYFFINNLEK
jgi:hypothetical protein